MARPLKPFRTSWGEDVLGLRPIGKNRWRISSSGERFTADEYTAVAKFKQSQRGQRITVFIPIATGTGVETAEDADTLDAEIEQGKISRPVVVETDDPDVDSIGYLMDETATWEWFRKQILERPIYVAQQCRIPQLANLSALQPPQASIPLETIIAAYEQHSAAKTEHAKKVAAKALRRLIDHSGAQTLVDLSTERLMAFRDSIETDPSLTTGGSKKAIFRKIKTVLGFALKRGMDAEQIRACLDRCKVLWTACPESQVDPRPISRDKLHLLLNAAVGKQAKWKAWILVALNCALKMGDVVRLKWESLDLKKKIYATIREKTALKSIPQVAVLWDETIEALNALPRLGPYVFTSCHGSHFNRCGKGNEFARFRTAAEAKREDGSWMCFDDFRDGAYTACCLAGIDNRLCRLLAGHKSEGLQDNYVLRNPQMVSPANAAVYRHYFG